MNTEQLFLKELSLIANEQSVSLKFVNNKKYDETGIVYLMRKFKTILIFTYRFEYTSFSVSFHEGAGGIKSKQLEGSCSEVQYHDYEKISSFFDDYSNLVRTALKEEEDSKEVAVTLSER